MESWFLALDLKSFYASVECVSRGLEPLKTHLVVADGARTEKTICLAVTPSLKALGIPGRPRLFEVVQKVGEVNALRRAKAPKGEFQGKSHLPEELANNPALAVDYIVAKPRMALYMQTSLEIYKIYLKYLSPEDIHVYSIDEVFLNVTHYLKTYAMTPQELARKLMKEVVDATGVTATAGIGTNLFLSKVAMDIYAKHQSPDEHGARVATLDEETYRRELWSHRPLTDFWRVGRGYAKKLEAHGLYTMGDIARCSLGKDSEFYNENLLYRLFGVQAELLIDHAWGWEPCTIEQIKAYKPQTHSLGSGQVLCSGHSYAKARLILQEMADALSLDLVSKGLVASQIVVTVGYDRDNWGYQGPSTTDRYGRKIPKHAHGTQNLPRQTASTKWIVEAAMTIFDREVDKSLLIRRLNIVAAHVVSEAEAMSGLQAVQLDLFADTAAQEAEEQQLEREKRRQKALLAIQDKYGKNAILKGISYLDGATARQRNGQIGGHSK